MADPADPGETSPPNQAPQPGSPTTRIALGELGTVAYTAYGVGTPVVLLHANPGDHRDYDGIIPSLARRYRVIGLDWPGYGASPPPPVEASAAYLAEVLEAFTAKLGITGAVFIGNSVGAYAAVRLALDHPQRVRALVLVSPAGFTDLTPLTRLLIRIRGTIWFTRWFGYLLARWYLKRRTAQVRAILERAREERSQRERLAVDTAIWRSFARPESDLRADAERIAVPTLLVFGHRDPLIRLSRDGRAALATMPGARCLALDTGHEPFAEDPETFLQAVAPFLEQVLEPRPSARSPVRRGIVFVHGVGSQDKSQTLLDFTVPLLHWLHDWSTANGTAPPAAQRAALGFTPFDSGPTDRSSRVTIDLPSGDRWLCTEEWWAHSTRRIPFQAMLLWLSGSVGDVLAQLGRAMWQRIRRDTGEAAERARRPKRWFVRGLDILYAVVMGLLFALGLILVYPLLALLVLLAQLPIDVLQQWVFGTALRAFLEINVAEQRVLLEDPVQGANVNARLARNIRQLAEDGCREVFVVAHSGGTVASFAMLTDPHPEMQAVARRVTKLITIGSGLNKGYLLAPEAECVRRTLPGHIHWVDIWATYDPVPAGWLDPRPMSTGWPRFVPIFHPSAELIRRQHYTQHQLRSSPDPYGTEPRGSNKERTWWPESLEVTNTMSAISDHGGYMSNFEQVVGRLIAEFDAEYYQDSPFWHGAQPTGQAVAARGQALRGRRARVGVLAAVRLLVTAGVLVPVVWLEVELVRAGGAAGLKVAVDHVPQQATLAHQLADWLKLVGNVFGWMDTLPMSLLGALAIALVGYTLYNLYRLLFWVPWDSAAQERRVMELATVAGPLAMPMLYPSGRTEPGPLVTFRYPPRPPIVGPGLRLPLALAVVVLIIALALRIRT